METPKMMAAVIKPSNLDVVTAIAPHWVSRHNSPTSLYGMFVVINEPRYVYNEHTDGILLCHSIISEQQFEEEYSFLKSIDPFSGEFFRVRHKHNTSPFRRQVKPLIRR